METLIDNCILGIGEQRALPCSGRVQCGFGYSPFVRPWDIKIGRKLQKCNRTGIPVRQIVLEEGLLPEEELDRYLSLVDMTQAGHPVDYKL